MTDQQAFKNECIQLWRSGTKQRTIMTTGLSMHPLISAGSTLTFVPSSADRAISLGDIALFERDDTLIAHRIVGRFHQNGSLWLREKGDNTFLPGSFPADALIGRVVKIEHSGHVRDLTGLRSRFADRLVGIYWCALFAVLRGLAVFKRMVCGASQFPRLRAGVLNSIRFLSRLPTRFSKS